ncbi:MAG: ABC transporter ATP-binding protein [Nitrososphaeria archaeon]|nr:ABC transporter ATP-binding protein [Aigarchaeota archaeon]MCX8187283.1 ABC transporter ATP-binding protein [Nitrososphaeria archaeon]MDW8021019.1 ABC transporter ATP-binding protein [Nitrososphaerota archaeon]
MTEQEILSVENLFLYYRLRNSIVRAVDCVSFGLPEKSAIALVGESGCGKSSTAIALMRLLPPNTERYEGRIRVNELDVSKMSEDEFRRKIRWRVMSMVFQGAMNALNPVLKVGFQAAEPLIHNFGYRKEEALALAEEVLEEVGLPKGIAERYPHELSGGMKQRVCIAMALVTKPKIVILDEPTSALDIITQANIINLLKDLKKERGLSYVLITHDLALSSELADYVAVMYGGKIVERGPADDLYVSPAHPYMKMLLNSLPRLRQDIPPSFISGAPPDLRNPPPGCRFHPRCPFSILGKCDVEEPPALRIGKDHYVMCWLYGGENT